MLDFVNFNSGTKDKDQFLVFAKKYVDFAYQDEEALKKYHSLSESLFDGVENTESEKISKLLKNLQKHLKTILNSVIAPQKTSKEIQLKGVKTVKFKNQEMIEVFKSEKIQNTKMTLVSEKKNLESAFIEMLINSDVVLNWFKKCQNQKCTKFIYDRKKKYCDSRCRSSRSQRDYQEKKNKK